jgi:hypothetical protein
MVDSKLLANVELKSLLGAQLMRNLHQTLPEIYSEVEKTVSELIPSGDDGLCQSSCGSPYRVHS